MLAANDNVDLRNRELAIWKMMRAGLPTQVICEVLRQNGNMSSATVMFVLDQMLREAPGDKIGCAMAFGPGLTAETMMFHTCGNA